MSFSNQLPFVFKADPSPSLWRLSTKDGMLRRIILIFEFLPNNLLAKLPQHFSRNRVPGPRFSLPSRVNFAIDEVGTIVLVQLGFEGGIHVCCRALREGLD